MRQQSETRLPHRHSLPPSPYSHCSKIGHPSNNLSLIAACSGRQKFFHIFLGLVQSEGADLLSHCRGVGAILARAIEFVSAQNILKRRYTIHNI